MLSIKVRRNEPTERALSKFKNLVVRMGHYNISRTSGTIGSRASGGS